jgi:5-methylcytosine-specific restriction endonuclease McrA
MSRIRTIKPEFWTDDLLGSLSRDVRMLFIATWNLADDEGLLRWSAPYLKGAVFPFDDDLSIKDVEKCMVALSTAGIMFPYNGGRSQQPLAYIVNFHKHQKINRPSPSKLPPPSLQDVRVRDMYAARDQLICHLCDGSIDENANGGDIDFCVSVDHITPVSKGGSDYPSNIKAAHLTCNKGRGNRSIEEYRAIVMSGKTHAQRRNPERFTHISHDSSLSNSVSQSVNASDQDREGEREQEGKRNSEPIGSDASASRDIRGELFGQGLETLARITGKTPDSCRSLVGKWLKSVNDEAIHVKAAIQDAERNRVADPVAWINRALSPYQGNRNGNSVHDAAKRQLEQFRALNQSEPSGLRDGTSENPVRLLSSR